MIEKVLFFICVSNLNIEIRRKFKLGVCVRACACTRVCTRTFSTLSLVTQIIEHGNRSDQRAHFKESN
ncbi:unknown [Spodoptera litura nucleopolyhedrovirus]|uniref:Uncharacterized protein n=1 Tax=Spodoptera litura multicapsid nucleopolyhedrovirus TaxID=46242 RepID=Q91BG7_NPVST|nr:hypothetical protein [Spodoptera litura nucleopolyhedrovirus]AAL01828.1 unknown [Spodoptera litura nucleopolyhedrovirus]QHN73908.1 hypothetical protein [Spodoptera litura nucleopolyhedrovirus]